VIDFGIKSVSFGEVVDVIVVVVLVGRESSDSLSDLRSSVGG
jgi:hypothetical protein